MQRELTESGPLLDREGRLHRVGWSRSPVWTCNLEDVGFYPRPLRLLQFMRLKRWDYYAIFSPERFFSATVADLGYAGNVFVYTLDFETGDLHEEALVIPWGRGVSLSRETLGICEYRGRGAHLRFEADSRSRRIAVDWPGFHDGRGIEAEISLQPRRQHESMNIVIPIAGKRFYYNHKINCLAARGSLRYGDLPELELRPETSLGQLDWGRGVWPYRSFWNWASASGFLSDGRTVGLNLGCGFGDTSAASENALLLDGRVHKLDQVNFDYDPSAYDKPWKFTDNEGRLDLDFVPFKDRSASTQALVISSTVHQVFGRYSGQVETDSGEVIALSGLVGFAEEHRARW